MNKWLDGKPHKRLDVWRRSLDLVEEVYKLTALFPRSETYALTDQMRRAAISVPSNIAEGAARQTPKEFANFLHIAQGSLTELDTQIEIANRLGRVSDEALESCQTLLGDVDKMLFGLIRSLRVKS